MSYNPNSSGTPVLARSSGPSSPNLTGSSIPKATPVRIGASGMALVDPGIEVQVDGIAGLTRTAVANNASGDVINSGLLEDVTVSFAVGSAVYLGKDGYLTDVRPSIGAGGFLAGDLIVRLGVIGKNVLDSAKKDVLVNIQIVGML